MVNPFLDISTRKRAPRRRVRSGLAILFCLLVAALGSGCSTTPRLVETPPPEVVHEEVPVKPAEPAVDAWWLTADKRLARWKLLVKEEQFATSAQKLASVNTFFNRLKFVDDMTYWGQEDYWATPEEMLIKNGGDCEDFTIAKYFTLRSLQVPEESMRLTYVRSLMLNKPHMVLSYYHNSESEPLVLDNLINPIVPASQRLDLIPVYSFNVENLWLAKRGGQEQWLGKADKLGRWREFLVRIAANDARP